MPKKEDRELEGSLRLTNATDRNTVWQPAERKTETERTNTSYCRGYQSRAIIYLEKQHV